MIDGLSLPLIKSKKIPEGFMRIRDFARECDVSNNAITVWIRSGGLQSKYMKYWPDPKGNNKPITIVSDMAIEIYKNKPKRISSDEVVARAEKRTKLTDNTEDTEWWDSDDNTSVDDIQDGVSFNEAKRFREVNRAKKEALELQVAQNELIEVGLIKDMVTQMGLEIQQKLMSSIPRIASLVTACKDTHTNIAIMQEEFENVLKSLITHEDIVKENK